VDVGHYIVRAGLVRPRSLIAGTTRHLDIPGLSGFSVQSAPGLSVEELARAGRFPHSWIGVTDLDTILLHGFKLVFPTPGKGDYHATIRTSYPLSPDAAVLLSRLFIRHRNPYRVT
jgi:hypothetical protein